MRVRQTAPSHGERIIRERRRRAWERGDGGPGSRFSAPRAARATPLLVAGVAVRSLARQDYCDSGAVGYE